MTLEELKKGVCRGLNKPLGRAVWLDALALIGKCESMAFKFRSMVEEGEMPESYEDLISWAEELEGK